MKKSLFVSSIVASSLIFGAVGVYAGSNLEQISAYLNKGLNLKLKGEVWTARDPDGKVLYPITYEGSTYLPVRAVGEAFGVNVGWDGDTQSILIGEAAAQKPAANSKVSRSSPAGIGESVNFAKKDTFDDYSTTYKLEQIVRGPDALKMVKSFNHYNDDPKDGYEYLLAKVTVKLDKNSKKDTAVKFSSYSFTAVSAAGVDYERVGVSSADPEFSFNLYEGGSGTGWIGFMVKKDDPNTLITVERNYDGSGGVWFKTF